MSQRSVASTLQSQRGGSYSSGILPDRGPVPVPSNRTTLDANGLNQSSGFPGAGGSGKEKLKLVIRFLPPNIDEAWLMGFLMTWANEQTLQSYYFVQGRVSRKGEIARRQLKHEQQRYGYIRLGSSQSDNLLETKPDIYSRLYLTMKNQEALVRLVKEFNRSVVPMILLQEEQDQEDEDGDYSLTELDSEPAKGKADGERIKKKRIVRPIIEYAPFQGKLKSSNPPETAGTITQDEDYQSFLKIVEHEIEEKKRAKNEESKGDKVEDKSKSNGNLVLKLNPDEPTIISREILIAAGVVKDTVSEKEKNKGKKDSKSKKSEEKGDKNGKNGKNGKKSEKKDKDVKAKENKKSKKKDASVKDSADSKKSKDSPDEKKKKKILERPSSKTSAIPASLMVKSKSSSGTATPTRSEAQTTSSPKGPSSLPTGPSKEPPASNAKSSGGEKPSTGDGSKSSNGEKRRRTRGNGKKGNTSDEAASKDKSEKDSESKPLIPSSPSPSVTSTSSTRAPSEKSKAKPKDNKKEGKDKKKENKDNKKEVKDSKKEVKEESSTTGSSSGGIKNSQAPKANELKAAIPSGPSSSGNSSSSSLPGRIPTPQTTEHRKTRSRRKPESGAVVSPDSAKKASNTAASGKDSSKEKTSNGEGALPKGPRRGGGKGSSAAGASKNGKSGDDKEPKDAIPKGPRGPRAKAGGSASHTASPTTEQ